MSLSKEMLVFKQLLTFFKVCCSIGEIWRTKQLMGDNVKVVLAVYSNLSQAVFDIRIIAWHAHARSDLELKTRLRAQCYKTFFVRNLRIFVLRWSVYQNRLEKLSKDKNSSLLHKLVNYGHRKFHNIGSWAQCYKTFFVRKLRIFVISQSVFHW